MNYLNNDEWLDGYETEISLFNNQEEGMNYETEYETDNYNSDYETDDEFINIISGKDKLIDILFKKIINLRGDNNILFKIKCSFLYYITEKDESKIKRCKLLISSIGVIKISASIISVKHSSLILS